MPIPAGYRPVRPRAPSSAETETPVGEVPTPVIRLVHEAVNQPFRMVKQQGFATRTTLPGFGPGEAFGFSSRVKKTT